MNERFHSNGSRYYRAAIIKRVVRSYAAELRTVKGFWARRALKKEVWRKVDEELAAAKLNAHILW